MKVAVLSFAHEMAATYARLLSDMPGVDLIVADPGAPEDDPDRGPAVAARLGVPYASGLDEVFAARPGLVVVTSEVGRRRELVERAAAAGAQVLCEQPLAAKETDAQSMVDACAAAGVRLTPAAPVCFSGAFAAVRRAIADGAVGTLTTLHGSYHGGPVTREPSEGGALAANAAPLLDLVDLVLGGDHAVEVYAQTNSVLRGEPGVESTAVVSVLYASGTVAAIDCGWSVSADPRAAHGPAMTFVGDRTSVDFDARPRLLDGYDAGTGAAWWEAGGADGYGAMLGAVVAMARDGHGTGPDGDAAVRTLRIVQAAYESVQTGQPVELTVPSPTRP